VGLHLRAASLSLSRHEVDRTTSPPALVSRRGAMTLSSPRPHTAYPEPGTSFRSLSSLTAHVLSVNPSSLDSDSLPARALAPHQHPAPPPLVERKREDEVTWKCKLGQRKPGRRKKGERRKSEDELCG